MSTYESRQDNLKILKAIFYIQFKVGHIWRVPQSPVTTNTHHTRGACVRVPVWLVAFTFNNYRGQLNETKRV